MGVALHAASLSGHVSTVRLLLEKGAMVDCLDVMKHTPLFRACEMGQRDVILTLIKGRPTCCMFTDTALRLSVGKSNGDSDLTGPYFFNGPLLSLPAGCARVDLVDVDGHTALHWAALGGNAEVCQVLMENGISPNVQVQTHTQHIHTNTYTHTKHVLSRIQNIPDV